MHLIIKISHALIDLPDTHMKVRTANIVHVHVYMYGDNQSYRLSVMPVLHTHTSMSKMHSLFLHYP